METMTTLFHLHTPFLVAFFVFAAVFVWRGRSLR